MAGKKPAKPMAGQSKQAPENPAIYGTQVMFMGSKLAKFTCDKCGKSIVRGMIRVLGDTSYCSKACVTSVTKQKEEMSQ
jgi:predicted RNA-binding Zn-ribbon protein involved in translation (DUF1610 family)